jgi:radical SAM protein with 4Fe4S-binding SPASM domain
MQTENQPLKTKVSLVEQVVDSVNGKKIQYVKPDPNERKLTIAEAKGTVFTELKYFNLILTNACNLSCTYCFEQHKKDYGRFTLEKLDQMYHFLLDCNNDDGKLFQFFGGEPLSQKKLILDFCRTYKEKLSANNMRVRVSIVTNALLMTPEFVKEYFDYDFTQVVISLDTDDAKSDQREISQKGIDHIFNMLALIPKEKKDEHQVCIRCTINQESVPRLAGYIERLYGHGIRNMIIHPLILSRTAGAIVWDDNLWNQMHRDIVQSLEKFPDFKITWAEGVGTKGNSNCMVGSDMISMDASGDFSGCYFFTNIKESFGDTMLGNLFNNEIYVDRYVGFQKTYMNAMTTHEECRTCDLKGYCYQCPAGNLATSGEMFRPDGMCKKIVRLFLDLRNDITKKLFYTKLANIQNAVKAEGEIVLNKALVHLMYKWITKKYVKMEEVNNHLEMMPDYKNLMGHFKKLIQKEASLSSDIGAVILESRSAEPINAFDFYCFFCQSFGFDVPAAYKYGNTQYEEIYFIAMLHLLILDNAQFKRQKEETHAATRMLSI